MRITPKNIKKLKQNEIFVFGANRQGRHGKGSALTARLNFGAIYGQPDGLQGQSYGIITKELRKNYPPVSLKEVRLGVDKFIKFASENKDLTFYVVEIGCNLAGCDDPWRFPGCNGSNKPEHLGYQRFGYAQ